MVYSEMKSNLFRISRQKLRVLINALNRLSTRQYEENHPTTIEAKIYSWWLVVWEISQLLDLT